MCVQAEQCPIFPSDPFSWSNVWVMSGSKQAGKLHDCSNHRIPIPYSRPPAALQPIRAQYANEERGACHFGAGVQGVHGAARCTKNNALVFGKINMLIKIIQQQWNWEYSQTHNVWEYMCLSLSYFWEQWVTTKRFILRVAKKREKERSSWTENGVCRCLH